MFAAQSGWPVFGPEDQLRARWPVFHDLLVTHTPFRSVVALSLPGDLRGAGGMDIYLGHPVGVDAVDAVDAICVAGLVSARLSSAAAWTEWTDVEGPPWSRGEPARQRARVWVAMGMLGLALHLGTADALAVLRARAYADDRSVDELAADVVAGRLTAEQLRRGSDGDA
jgi:hypothetical protein